MRDAALSEAPSRRAAEPSVIREALPSFPELPCFPCPHHSACCAFGATVTDAEAEAIIADRGEGFVYQTRWGEWRTRVRGGRCVFLQQNQCVVHGMPYYPHVCRTFPWTDAEHGGPYEFDQTICPEFEQKPELTQIGRAVSHARNSRPLTPETFPNPSAQ